MTRFLSSFAVFVGYSIYLIAYPAIAETNAERVFGKWEKVSIEEIKRRVPEFEYERSSLGSVTNEYKRASANVPPCTLGNLPGYTGAYRCIPASPVLSSY